MSDSKKIFELIPKVMLEVGAIGKNGTNTQQNYKFRSIDDVYNALHPVLAKNGVFFVPSILESKEERLQTKNGASQVRVKIKVEYSVYASDGSAFKATVEGEGIDTGDKATNKALTAAFKYLLIQVFCIPLVDMVDADKDSPELNFVNEKTSKKMPEKKPLAPPTNVSDLKITQGKFKGKNLSEVPIEEIEIYVTEVSDALKAGGKNEPKWFSELRKASGF